MPKSSDALERLRKRVDENRLKEKAIEKPKTSLAMKQSTQAVNDLKKISKRLVERSNLIDQILDENRKENVVESSAATYKEHSSAASFVSSNSVNLISDKNNIVESSAVTYSVNSSIASNVFSSSASQIPLNSDVIIKPNTSAQKSDASSDATNVDLSNNDSFASVSSANSAVNNSVSDDKLLKSTRVDSQLNNEDNPNVSQISSANNLDVNHASNENSSLSSSQDQDSVNTSSDELDNHDKNTTIKTDQGPQSLADTLITDGGPKLKVDPPVIEKSEPLDKLKQDEKAARDFQSRYLGISPEDEEKQEKTADVLKKIAEKAKGDPKKAGKYVKLPDVDSKKNHVQEAKDKAKIEGEEMRKKKQDNPLDHMSDYVTFGKPKNNNDNSKSNEDLDNKSKSKRTDESKDKKKKSKSSNSKLKRAGIAGAAAAAFLAGSIGVGYIWSKADSPKQVKSTPKPAVKNSSVKLKGVEPSTKSSNKKDKLTDFKPAKKQSSKTSVKKQSNQPEIESSDANTSKSEKAVQQKLNNGAKATKQPYRITTSEIGGGYIQGVVTYYPKDSTKTYNDYSITAPKKPGSGTDDAKSRQIERKLKSSLPKVNKTINVKDKSKVTMRTYKQGDGTYNTILLYDKVPFAFVKTDKNNKMINNVTTYYIQKVAKGEE